MEFKLDECLEYDKVDLIRFWIDFREKKKELESNIKLITKILMDNHEIDGKEQYWEYLVFESQKTSYTPIDWYDYSWLQAKRPDLFQPNKSKMYKEYPDTINRKITTTIEMSMPKNR